MTIIKNGIINDADPVRGNPARPFADRPIEGGLCDEGHRMVARYRYYGFTWYCIVCEPDEDEDQL